MPRKSAPKPIKDITDQRFGRLVAKRHVGFTKYRNALWECLCDCGTKVQVSQGKLKDGTRSCGCLRLDRVHETKALPPGEAGFNYLFRAYKHNAHQKKLTFRLTQKEFRRLVQSPCHYCGEPPSNKTRNGGDRTGHSEFTHNGIDRMDNAVGYILTNSVSCCKTCNYAKRGLTVTEFLMMAVRIVRHQAAQGGEP